MLHDESNATTTGSKQHLPYPIAKFIRALMNPKAKRASSLAVWETEILRVAWTELYQEGKLPRDFGGSS